MNTETVYKNVLSHRETAEGPNALRSFLILTFILSWGAIVLLILFYDQIVSAFGDSPDTNPVFILAVYSPGIVGVLTIWQNYGLRGLGSFFRRLTLWRAPVPWWLFILLGIPALVYAAAAVNGTISDPFPFSPWYLVMPAVAHALFLGPIEELGWRGFALPLLQRRFAPIWSGLILGIIWAVWHIPAFLLSGTAQSAWSFGPFFIGVVAISIILTPLFNAARGSLLIAVLYHFQMMNPIWPDAQPWDNLFFTAVALIVVLLNRREMFKRGKGVTTILFPGDR